MNNKRVGLAIVFVIFSILTIIFYIFSSKMYILQKMDYLEKGSTSYKVYLNDNKYYGTEYLNEGMKYISSIIDNVDITFDYDAKYDEQIDYNTILKATAELQIVDPNNSKNIIYNFKEVLQDDILPKKTSNEVKVNKNFKIDYQKYNKLVNEFKSTYGISADSNLKITYLIYYIGSNNNFNNINKSKTYVVDIPLSEQTINITKSLDFSDNLTFKQETNKTMSNKVFLIFAAASLLVSLYAFVSLIIGIIKFNKKQSLYQRKLEKILRQYDSYITESSNDIDITGKTVIDIKSFKELLDVRKNIEKAIIFVKIDNRNSKFLIVDENQVYRYKFSEE